MRIAIDLNGTLRDTILKMKQVYTKFYVESSTENSDGFEYKINEPIDSLDLIKHFEFPNKEDFYSFLYEDHPMEIFGHSPSVEFSSMHDLNDFYYKRRDSHDIIITSDEIGKSKPATLFFLSKYGCLIEKIIFYSEVTINSMWNEIDILLTANPELLLNKPEGKIVVKYETEYNKNINSELKIKKFKEFDEILKEIL